MNQVSIDQYRLFLRIIESLCLHYPYFIIGEMQLHILGYHSIKNIFMMLGCLHIMWMQMSPKILQVESKFIRYSRNISHKANQRSTKIPRILWDECIHQLHALCGKIALWHGKANFKARKKTRDLFYVSHAWTLSNFFFFHMIFFHLLGKNNDVNMLDKFFLIVGVSTF